MRDTQNTYQPLYNYRLLAFQIQRLGLTPEQVSKRSCTSVSSVNAALAGNLGTLKKLRLIADVLQVNWEFITRTDLPESQFRRAVFEAGR